MQTYGSHARYVPGYHFVLSAILSVWLMYAIVQLVRVPSVATGMNVLLSVGLILMWWYVRAFAVRVQDRVIRLEETMRIARVAPQLKDRLGELSTRQLIALRFASDDEVAGLCARALDEKLGARAIKSQVKTWRPDHVRV